MERTKAKWMKKRMKMKTKNWLQKNGNGSSSW